MCDESYALCMSQVFQYTNSKFLERSRAKPAFLHAVSEWVELDSKLTHGLWRIYPGDQKPEQVDHYGKMGQAETWVSNLAE